MRDVEPRELRDLLAIPRPRSRGDCAAGPRPCPWVACEHHLLLEVGRRTTVARKGAANRSPGLMLNAPRARGGRREQLASSAAAELVRVWIDDALELLWGMPDSCALDVAERGESSPSDVQLHTGRSSAGVRAVRREAIAALARASVQTSAIKATSAPAARKGSILLAGEKDSTGRSTYRFGASENSEKPKLSDGGGR